MHLHEISRCTSISISQAGSEVSTLLGRMPSAVGYQPTLSTEMGSFLESRVIFMHFRCKTSGVNVIVAE